MLPALNLNPQQAPPLPPETQRVMTVRMPRSLYIRLSELSDLTKISMNQLCVTTITEMVTQAEGMVRA